MSDEQAWIDQRHGRIRHDYAAAGPGDYVQREAEKRWPPNDDPRQWGPALRFIPAGKREAYVAGYVDGHGAASRQREGAPSIEDVAETLYEGSRTPGDSPAWQGLFSPEARAYWLAQAERVVALYAPAPDTKEDQ